MRRLVAGRVQERVFNVKDFCKTVKQYQVCGKHSKPPNTADLSGAIGKFVSFVLNYNISFPVLAV